MSLYFEMIINHFIMPSLKVISWNIQNLSIIKLDKTLIKFIANTVIEYNADILGIMEILSHAGTNVVERLTRELNRVDQRALTGNRTWKGKESEHALDSRQEQYAYLWLEEVGHLVADPNGFEMPGILNAEAFDDIVGSRTNADILFNVLQREGFVSRRYRIRKAKFNDLRNPIYSLNLGADTGNYTVTQLTQIKKILLDAILIGFPSPNKRPPFLANFLVGNNQFPVPMSILHAPGPSDAYRFEVVNNLGIVPRLASEDDGLVMGDFNLKQTERDYHRSFIFTQNGEVEQDANGNDVLRHMFSPIEQLDFVEKLSDESSLKRPESISDGVKSWKSCTNQPYDRFFLKEGLLSNLQFQNANVLDILDRLLYMNAGTDIHGPAFLLAQSVLRAELRAINRRIGQINRTLNTLAKQSKKGKKGKRVVKNSNQLTQEKTALKRGLKAFETIKTKNRITSIKASHLAYFTSISDHLPILITVNY